MAKHRRRESAFVVEGPRLFLAACQARQPIEHVITAPDLLTSRAALEEAARLSEIGIPSSQVSADVFASMSLRDHPTGIAAIVGARERDPVDIPDAPDGLFVALARVADPGNLGTILRTLDAAGGAGLLLVGATTDPHHPTAVKASMGALFTVPWARVADVQALCDWSVGRGLRTVGTSAHAPAPPDAVVLGPPLVLVFGPERDGLSPEELLQLDDTVGLPMWGEVTSLNLAVAAGILIYDARRAS